MLPSRAGARVSEPAIVSPALTPSTPCQPSPASSTFCQIPALRSAPASPGCQPGREQGRDDGEQHGRQTWCRSKHPTHPPPDFILFPSQCLAAYHSRAFYSPQLQPRRAPSQLPAAALLLHASSPGQGGMDDIPGVPVAVQAEESMGCGGRPMIKP